MNGSKTVLLSLVVETNDDGYLASAPGLQGAFAEGDSVEEAIFNCIEVVKLIVAYRAERGESVGLGVVDLVPDMRLTVVMPVGVG